MKEREIVNYSELLEHHVARTMEQLEKKGDAKLAIETMNAFLSPYQDKKYKQEIAKLGWTKADQAKRIQAAKSLIERKELMA